MSLRIAPAAATNAAYTHTTPNLSAPSAPGLHDTLRHGVGPSARAPSHTTSANTPASTHPLEARLKSWEATQENLRLQMLRRVYGIGEPVRQAMELKIVKDSEWRPEVLKSGLPSVHEDILRGNDLSITWEDIYTGDGSVGVAGFHAEMEHKLKIN